MVHVLLSPFLIVWEYTSLQKKLLRQRKASRATESMPSDGDKEMSLEDECVFCQIIKKEVKSWVVWESQEHLAFLSIYPNMKGVTVVIPKEHKSSYAFDLDDDELTQLMLAAKKVAKLLDAKLEGVGRTAVVLEGFGVNHMHVKLYPLPNTSHLSEYWKPVHSNNKQYFTEYLGFISSNDSHRASDDDLDILAQQLSYDRPIPPTKNK